MKKTRLFLFRHGEVANAKDRVLNGHFNIPLSEEGVHQFETIGNKLASEKIDAAYSSDLIRSVHSAQLIANGHSLEIQEQKELRELNYGVWEGKKIGDVMKNYKDEMRKRYSNIVTHRIENGETLLEMEQRVLTKLKEILKNHYGETIFLVAHGGVNRIILLWALESKLKNFYRIQQEYGALNIINYYPNDEIEVELMNAILYRKELFTHE